MEDFISFQIYEVKMDATKYLTDLIKIAKQTTGVEVEVNDLPTDLNDGIVKILGELPQGKKKKFIDAAEDYIDKHNLVDDVSELALKKGQIDGTKLDFPAIKKYLNENKINDIEFSLKNVDDEYVVLSKINNKIIGELRFFKSKYKPVLKAGSVVVQPNYRRKGIATAMYDFAEKQLNLKFEKNTDVLTPDGKLFWSSRN